MTDADKLEAIKQYVMEMAPIYRPAILLSDEEKAYNDGYEDAMFEAQHSLLEILEGIDEHLAG